MYYLIKLGKDCPSAIVLYEETWHLPKAATSKLFAGYFKALLQEGVQMRLTISRKTAAAEVLTNRRPLYTKLITRELENFSSSALQSVGKITGLQVNRVRSQACYYQLQYHTRVRSTNAWLESIFYRVALELLLP